MRIVKLLGGLMVACALMLAGVYAYAARDVGPSHPSLAAAALPELIPIRDFFANTSAEWAYAPSPDGSMIAWYAVEWAKTVIRIRRSGETEHFATLSGSKFQDFWWDAQKNDLLVTVEGRLWRVNPDKPGRGDWTDVTPRGFQNWQLVSTPARPEDALVVASNDRNPAFFDLYRIHRDGGGKRISEKNDGQTVDWWLDDAGVARIRADRLDNEATRYLIRDSATNPWRTLTEAAARDNFTILFAPAKGGALYALSDRGRERIALVTLDPQTGQETVVADHPKVDVRKAFRLGAWAKTPDFISFEAGYPEFKPISARGEAFLKLLLDHNNPVDFNILATSPDGRFVSVARSWREQSFEYFLYDLEKLAATKVAEYDFRRYKNILAETRPVSFKARDGLEIPGLLVLPRGVEPKSLPTIVHIHGGPALQQLWAYDQEFQFLANRGYAVLSVNFRGSTGYGKTFRAAGFGEVGKKMQDDIVDAANWLVAQGIADKADVAVMGASYGGYSAAFGMTRDPGVFKAAIVEYAVTDVAYQMQNNPFAWGLFRDETKRYFGDPESTTDLQKMRELSPLANAGNANGAILITAGKQDNVVGFEQSEEFERALKAAGKDVTAVYFEHEGHGYTRWQTAVRRGRLIEDFLARRLGGRSGGFDYVELAAEYLN